MFSFFGKNLSFFVFKLPCQWGRSLPSSPKPVRSLKTLKYLGQLIGLYQELSYHGGDFSLSYSPIHYLWPPLPWSKSHSHLSSSHDRRHACIFNGSHQLAKHACLWTVGGTWRELMQTPGKTSKVHSETSAQPELSVGKIKNQWS